jgi:hypothetical protein
MRVLWFINRNHPTITVAKAMARPRIDRIMIDVICEKANNPDGFFRDGGEPII